MASHPRSSVELPNADLYPPTALTQELEKEGDVNTAFGDKSPGVRRIEAIAKSLTPAHKWVLWISVLLTAYSYGLDLTVRYTYQYNAVSAFGSAAQVSTVTVVRAIVAAAAQPLYAKISDYFGRLSILFIAVLFYVVGTILQAAANNLDQFLGGAVLYQFGYTGTQLLVEILVADTTPLKNRLFFSFIPSAPYLINTWVAANVASAVLTGGTGWRWGIGMWCIIFPACTIPLFFSLISAEFRAKKAGLLDGIPSGPKAALNPALWTDIFWQLDFVGIVLIAGFFIMVLLPFTLFGGTTYGFGSTWKSARAIAPIVVGFVIVLPLWIFWESRIAKHPAVPFRLLKDRQVLACLTIACLLNAAWSCQGDYMYYTLIIAFNQTIKQTGYIQNIYSFVSTLIGISLGVVVTYVRRLKYFVVAGTALSVVAFGILLRFRSSEHGGVAGLIAGEVLLGVAFGLFSYPAMTLIQTAVQHERLAVITSLYLASYSIGSALGNTIAGGIWINHFPAEALKQMNAYGVNNASGIALYLYQYPSYFPTMYDVGTPERTAAIHAYAHLQKLLCIAGISIAALIFFASLFLKNPVLGNEQTLPNAEGFSANEPAGNIPAVYKEGGATEEERDGASEKAHSRQA